MMNGSSADRRRVLSRASLHGLALLLIVLSLAACSQATPESTGPLVPPAVTVEPTAFVVATIQEASSSTPVATVLVSVPSPTATPSKVAQATTATMPLLPTQTPSRTAAPPKPTATLSVATATLPKPTATLPAATPTPLPPTPNVAGFTEALANQEPNPFFQLSPGAEPQSSQGGGWAPETQHPFVQLFPDLRAAPAPPWLREGTRITYYGQGATLGQTGDAPGSSWAGVMQFDLVALDSQAAVASLKLYLLASNNELIPSMVVSSVGVPAAGDFWVHPLALERAELAANPELVVLRMPTTVSGQSYQAVRFQYQPEGAEYVWMFDEASGILLFYRHAIGNLRADISLVNQRQLSLPWRAEAPPDWAAQGARLMYDGSFSALAMGYPAGSFPYSVSVQIKGTHSRWTEYEVIEQAQGQAGNTSKRVSGVAQIFDALWLPPDAAAALSGETVLDRDPVTGAEVLASLGQDGEIVLAESGKAYRVVLSYDSSDGSLQSIEQETTTGAATTMVKLSLLAP